MILVYQPLAFHTVPTATAITTNTSGGAHWERETEREFNTITITDRVGVDIED